MIAILMDNLTKKAKFVALEWPLTINQAESTKEYSLKISSYSVS